MDLGYARIGILDDYLLVLFFKCQWIVTRKNIVSFLGKKMRQTNRIQ